MAARAAGRRALCLADEPRADRRPGRRPRPRLALLDEERPRRGEPDRRGFEWHYWRRRTHPERRAWWLPGAVEGAANNPRLSPDGTLLAVTEFNFARDRAWLVVREVESGRERRRFPLETEGPLDNFLALVAFSGDSSRLAVGWVSPPAPGEACPRRKARGWSWPPGT